MMRKGLPAKLAQTDADDTRYLFSGLVVCNTDGTPRGGILSPVGVNLVTATATMNVSVARFQGAAVRDAGVVLLANDGPADVLLDAAPAANSRIDVVWARQNDASSTVSVPDADNLPMFGVTKGTAGAVPVKPTIPAGTLELATVQIPSTATATNSPGVVITQTEQFTAGAGGAVPFRTKSALDAWTTAQVGQHANVLTERSERVWSGTGWVGATGRVPIVPTSVSGSGVTLGPGGAIILTAATAVSVNGCFTTEFDNYEIVIDVVSPAVEVLNMQLRAGGANITTANYNRQFLFAIGTTTTAAGAVGQPNWQLSPLDTNGAAGTINLFAPALPRNTRMLADLISTTANTVVSRLGGHFLLGTVVDGFSITTSASTITGTFRIYGYNNNA